MVRKGRLTEEDESTDVRISSSIARRTKKKNQRIRRVIRNWAKFPQKMTLLPVPKPKSHQNPRIRRLAAAAAVGNRAAAVRGLRSGETNDRRKPADAKTRGRERGRRAAAGREAQRRWNPRRLVTTVGTAPEATGWGERRSGGSNVKKKKNAEGRRRGEKERKGERKKFDFLFFSRKPN